VTNTLVGLTGHSSAAANQGDVVRITLTESRSAAPKVTGVTTVASGFGERPDAAAFVRGPTGLALGSSGTLYVADNLGNRIASIPDALSRTTSAGTGRTLSQGGQLANPLGMVLAPDGDLLVANATNGKIVEITPAGRQAGEYYADDSIGQEPPGNGDLFDLAVNQSGTGVLFVNDGTNALEVLH
jgi:sugar lactone lactonase YvrE